MSVDPELLLWCVIGLLLLALSVSTLADIWRAWRRWRARRFWDRAGQ